MKDNMCHQQQHYSGPGLQVQIHGHAILIKRISILALNCARGVLSNECIGYNKMQGFCIIKLDHMYNPFKVLLTKNASDKLHKLFYRNLYVEAMTTP